MAKDAFQKMKKIPYGDEFGREEFDTIRKGMRAKAPGDRWDVVFRKDTLYCRRARSGQGAYQVRIKRMRYGAGIVKWAKASKDIMVMGKHYEAALLDFLIARVLLDLDVPFPRHKKIEQDREGGFQKMVFGTEHPEIEVTNRTIKGQFK